MRKAASIFTRAACLVATDARLKNGSRARFLSMSGLLRAVRRELYPDPRRKVPDGEPTEAAWAWAYGLIPQMPIDRAPEARDLINAARKLRRMAEDEEHPLPTAAEIRLAERKILGLSTERFEFSDRISITVRPHGFSASVLHSNGLTHDLIQGDSLEELVAAAKEAKAKCDPRAKLRAEAARLGFALVERGAA